MVFVSKDTEMLGAGYVGKALDANVKEAANGLRDEIN
jgi:hypothetical protein